jgi:integrase
MSAVPVSPLRQRMIEDMSIRQFGEKTEKDYLRVVRDFAGFLGRSPDLAEPEDLRRYQLHLAAFGASPAKMGAAVSALRFFFKVTLARPTFGDRLATTPRPERQPVVLSPEEVAPLLHCAPSLKHQAALSVAYGGGLRASEIVHLKVGDIDSARMAIRVEQGKDRYVMLSPDLSALLRAWWRQARPRGWLFPGRDPAQPISTRTTVSPQRRQTVRHFADRGSDSDPALVWVLNRAMTEVEAAAEALDGHRLATRADLADFERTARSRAQALREIVDEYQAGFYDV